jgi:hypothetical protein
VTSNDGTSYHTWRGFHVTGNNGAHARLRDVFGIDPADLLIGEVLRVCTATAIRPRACSAQRAPE